ncbi:MAG: RnfABCDGE type electron transport complex subunit D, partial [Candidatus Omnitrophica bacterium]|nr:RnfABCDGE type electron transport complex subunit D [Candidatus Omnitrophota bacterium]
MKLIVSHSPHIYRTETIDKIMWSVSLSLIPAGLAGVLFFGYHALLVIFLCTFTAVFTEALIQILTKQKITIGDGSAFLTGLLLAYNLPPQVPFWIPLVGSFFSISIGKQIFGGLGQNIVNPALLGRVFLLASWPKYMTTFTKPNFNLLNFFKSDAITAPTPLSLLKESKPIDVTYLDLFLGNKGGCIGEVCVVALLLGALYLLIKKYIYLYIPLTYIGTVAIFTYIFGPGGFFKGDWLFNILSGGLILGAFFMATDYVTSPLTAKG